LNSPALGWALAVAAVAAGYVGYGWKGVALAITLVVFWLLLQFSRALRVMRQAAGRPVGEVANAVMFNARLKTGLRLMDVLPMTGSLGEKLADDPETFRWKDAGGDAVRVELRHGRVTAWQLERAAADAGS
jgi:hypothetical protein